jgi:hypothetical protein
VITNNDPKPAVTVSNMSTTEGDAGTKALQFTARLAAVAGVACTFTLATADATATAGSDYVPTKSRVTITTGSRTAAFPVTILGDQSPEPNESLVVKLTSPARCARGNQEAVGSIRNDDEAEATWSPTTVQTGSTLSASPATAQFCTFAVKHC